MKNPDTKYEANNRLIARAQAGDENAWRELIELNSPLVCNLATWHYSHVTSRVPLQELMVNGTSSLFFAVEKFDPNKGYKFSTYATWWIRQAFFRSYETLGSMYIPVHIYDLSRSLGRAQEALEASLGRPATLKELSEVTDTPVHMIQAVRRALSATSLDKPLAGNEDSTIGATLFDEDDSIEEQSIRSEEQQALSSHVSALLGILKRRERRVIELMYFNDLTLTQISELYGVSPQMVSLIKIRAMRKLRAAAKQQIAS